MDRLPLARRIIAVLAVRNEHIVSHFRIFLFFWKRVRAIFVLNRPPSPQGLSVQFRVDDGLVWVGLEDTMRGYLWMRRK
jgi:hypothetical protein